MRRYCSAKDTVEQCTVHNIQCAVHFVHFTVHCTVVKHLKPVQWTINCRVHCTVQSVQSKLHWLQCWVRWRWRNRATMGRGRARGCSARWNVALHVHCTVHVALYSAWCTDCTALMCSALNITVYIAHWIQCISVLSNTAGPSEGGEEERRGKG